MASLPVDEITLNKMQKNFVSAVWKVNLTHGDANAWLKRNA